MAQQLGLDLPSRPALGRDDFFVAPSNAIAVAMIEGWQAWAGRKMVLTGPPGSGKTHLAHVWANLSGAGIIDARDIATGDIPALAQGRWRSRTSPTSQAIMRPRRIFSTCTIWCWPKAIACC